MNSDKNICQILSKNQSKQTKLGCQLQSRSYLFRNSINLGQKIDKYQAKYEVQTDKFNIIIKKIRKIRSKNQLISDKI